MTDQFCYVPLIENGRHVVRVPWNEWYEDGKYGIAWGVAGVSSFARPIYRRVPFAVVLGLVEELSSILDWCHTARVPLMIQEIDSITNALAAAREAGIQPKEAK